MSAVVVCPECGATTTLEPDAPKTGTIPCRQCGNQVSIPAPKPAGPPPLPKPAEATAPAPGGPPPLPAAPSAAAGDFEVIEDEDDEDEELDEEGRPAVGRRRRDRDDDDEDDRPRRRYDDDDEDDDDDDYAPRRSARLRDEDEDDDDRPSRRRRDEEDEDEAPRRAARDEDEDDEDERPRRRSRDEDEDEDEDEDDRRRPAARDRDDDEDDEEDDRPHRRPADDDEDDDGPVVTRRRLRPDEEDEEEEEEEEEYEEPKSRKGLWIGLTLLILGLVGAGGAVAAYVLFFDKEPDKTVAQGTPPGGDGGTQPVNPGGPGPGANGGGPKQPTPKGPAAWKAPDRELAIHPVSFQGDRKTVNLPGVVADVCAGGDGRYLFLHCPDEQKLLVFDTSKVEVVKEIPTGGKAARFAAGATKLLLFDGVVRTLKRFDLVTLEQDKEEQQPVQGMIRDISLGSGSRGPALVLTDAAADGWPVHFVDVDTLKAADVGWVANPPADLPRDLRFRASAYGSRWVGTSDAKDAKGAVLVSRDGKAVSAARLLADKALGFAALSFNGGALFTRAGTFTLGAGAPREVAKQGDQYTVPATTGTAEVVVQPGEAPETVQLTVGSRARGSTPKSLNGVPQPLGTDEPGSPAQLIRYVPDAHAVFVVQPTKKHLEVVKFDLFMPNTKAVRITSTPPDRFTPGKPFEYPVRVMTNATTVTFSVNPPKDAKVAVSADGVVRWDVPADDKRDQLQFQVVVKGDGANATQLVKLYNTATPAPKPVAPKTEPKKGPPPSPESKGPVIAAGAKLVQPPKEKVPIPPATVAGAHQEIALPGPARDVCVGGGGRYLVFHVPTARQLVLFDTSALKVVKTMPVTTDDLMFAAGMDKLVVYYPAEKTLVRYTLATLKPETDTSLETMQRPTLLAMGSGTAGPLVLGNVPAQGNASKMALTFLDLESFKEVKIDKAEGEFQVTTATAVDLRVSTDGRTIGLWRTQLVPSGVQIARLNGNTIQGTYKGDSAGEVTPAADGQKVYTEQGAYGLDAKPTDPKGTVVPAVEGAGYVSLTGPATDKRTLGVFGAAADKPLATFDDVPGFDGKRDPFERDNPNLALDHRLFWVPDAGVLIVVAPTADKLHVYPVKK